jgi:hypothetical protein
VGLDLIIRLEIDVFLGRTWSSAMASPRRSLPRRSSTISGMPAIRSLDDSHLSVQAVAPLGGWTIGIPASQFRKDRQPKFSDLWRLGQRRLAVWPNRPAWQAGLITPP